MRPAVFEQRAHDTMHMTKIAPEVVNEFFGWDQKERKKNMSFHYKGRTEYLQLARVTLFL